MDAVATESAVAHLQERVTEGSGRLGVPGVAVGLLVDGEEHIACAGVTSAENPLPVTEHTLFQIGSTTKTYTATVLMRLVDDGKLSLDDTVKQHLPEFALADTEAERMATVLHLLNHTAGWDGDVYDSTGDGDDALAKLVARMRTFSQKFPPGAHVSYNNVSLSVAGRIIEKITGQTYEAAVKELLLRPLGMQESFFFLTDVATRRFSVGHLNRDDDVEVARPLGMARNGNPAGGIYSTVRDQLRYARFHLGDGRAQDGTAILRPDTLRRMQQPTVRVPTPEGIEHVGISWFIHERDGATTVEHGGNTIGFNHAFVMVPARRVAISVLTNSQPRGNRLEHEIVDWALEAIAGIRKPADPEPLELDAEQLREYTGVYSTEAVVLRCDIEGDHLVMRSEIRPAVLAALVDEGQEPPPTPPIPFKITPRDGAIVIDGDAKGMQFQFSRANGRINGVDISRFAVKEA